MTGRSLQAARTAASLLLVVAGVLLVLSERARWSSACSWGDFDTAACLLRQDHRFDQIVPGRSWTSLGSSSLWAGLGLLALGVALALLVPLISGRHDRVRRLVPGLVPAAGIVGAGVATLTAYATGHAAGGPLPGLAVYVWALTAPVVLLVSGLRAPTVDRPARIARWFVIGCVSASTPLVQYVVSPALVVYRSSGTPPWAWAASGVLLVAASLAVRPATRRTTSG